MADYDTIKTLETDIDEREPLNVPQFAKVC